jgi:toxin ParE1/3/4
LEFLDEIRAAYQRILDGPLKYAVLRSGIRRAITRRFPYGIYFSIDDDAILIIAVLHTIRDPAEWQLRV